MDFFNHFLPKTKDVVWTFPVHLKEYPRSDSISVYRGQAFDIKFIIFYIIIWIVASKKYGSPKINTPLFFSFIIGLLFLIFYSIWENRSFDIVYNKKTRNMVYSTSDEYYQILHKSPYKLPTKHVGAIIKNKNYFTQKKKGEIKSTQYKSQNQQKGWSDVTQEQNFTGATFQLMVVMFSLGILATYLKKKVFEHVWPWLILSVIFSFIQAQAPLWSITKQGNMDTYILKRRLFIIGLSFCLATALIILEINN